jgi:mono/diheme cytochrome c family protein
MVIFLVISGVMYLFVYLEPEQSAEKGEKDIRIPRAPAEASNIQNPIPNSPMILSEGEKIYQGKGTCFTCHGTTGRGDGPAGLELKPRPRDFTNSQFNALRTDGELFWVIQNGSPGTRMFSYSPSVITEEEAWKVIHYIRTFGETAQG